LSLFSGFISARPRSQHPPLTIIIADYDPDHRCV
jgi:hypothetical protein